MIALWIGIFFLLQGLTLLFAFAMCKSAALADREFERARAKKQRFWSQEPAQLHDTQLVKPEELQVTQDIIR